MSLPAAQLPREFRVAVWIAVIVGGLVGFGASNGAMTAISPPDLEDVLKATSAVADPAVRQLTEVALRTEYELGQSLRTPRAAVLLLLSFVCGLVVVSGMRLLYPAGVPRSGMRRITGGALVLAGILRTVEGAIQLVVARRTAEAMKKLELPVQVPDVDPGQLVSGVMVALTVGWTVALVGTLVGVAQYLRSERAKQIVATVDAAASHG